MTAPDIPALLAQAAHIWDTAGPPPNEDTTWADFWAERRAEDRAYERAQREAREEDLRW